MHSAVGLNSIFFVCLEDSDYNTVELGISIQNLHKDSFIGKKARSWMILHLFATQAEYCVSM